MRKAPALSVLLLLVAGHAEARELRRVWVELHQSGSIEVANQPVSLGRLAKQLRSASRDADIVCVWREQAVPDGRPAFNVNDEADMKRFENSIRAEAAIVETARKSDLLVFQHGDPECPINDGLLNS